MNEPEKSGISGKRLAPAQAELFCLAAVFQARGSGSGIRVVRVKPLGPIPGEMGWVGGLTHFFLLSELIVLYFLLLLFVLIALKVFGFVLLLIFALTAHRKP